MGYHRAGFDMTGIDKRPQPHYPFRFVLGDALEYLDEHGHEYDFIAASPPCQDHSMAKNSAGLHGTGWLLEATLARLRAQSLPWIVENVEGASLPSQSTLDGRHGVLLCGASFGLGASGMDLPRHRRFECSFSVFAPVCSHRIGETMGIYGHGTNAWHRARIGRNLTVAEMKEAMGIDWMTRDELNQAIPPVFTAFIGAQLLRALERAA